MSLASSLRTIRDVRRHVPGQGRLRLVQGVPDNGGIGLKMAAAQPEDFNGQDFSLSRGKRFVLPPQFRKALKYHNPEGELSMLLGKDPGDDCLVGYSLSRQEELFAQVTAPQPAEDGAPQMSLRRRKANAFSFIEVPFDASGRFVGLAYVPANHAKLGSAIDILIRDQPKRAVVVKRPFYTPAYRR